MRLLKFYGSYCSPCRKLTKDLESVNLMIELESYNVEDEWEMAEDYKVKSVPTVILLNEANREVRRWTGTFNVKEELKEFIKND